MNKIPKVVIGISILTVLILSLFILSETTIKSKDFTFSKVVSIEKSKIFNTMSNLEN